MFLLFWVGNRPFGVEMPLVKNIQRANVFFENHSVKKSEDILNLDDRQTPLFDLVSLFEMTLFLSENDSERPGKKAEDSHFPISDYDLEGKNVLLVEGAGSLGQESQVLALLVDRVDGAVTAREDGVDPLPPVFDEPALTCFPKVLKHEGQLVPILVAEGFYLLPFRHKFLCFAGEKE